MMDKCKELLKSIAKQYDGKLFPNYSGRRMYGKTCLGIVCSIYELDNLIQTAVENGLPEPETDNLGFEMIAYWPSLKEEDCGSIRPIS